MTSVDLQQEFYIACENNDIKKTLELIDIPYINSIDDGKKALDIVISKGHIDIAKILLNDARVNPNTSDNSIFIKCIMGNDVELVKLFLQHPRFDASVYEIRRTIYDGLVKNSDILNLLLDDPRVDVIRWNINTIYKIRFMDIEKFDDDFLYDILNINIDDDNIYDEKFINELRIKLFVLLGKNDMIDERDINVLHNHIVIDLFKKSLIELSNMLNLAKVPIFDNLRRYSVAILLAAILADDNEYLLNSLYTSIPLYVVDEIKQWLTK